MTASQARISGGDGERLSVVVDVRERSPWMFQNYSVEVVRAELKYGGYSLLGFEERVAVKRLSVAELTEYLTRNRDGFERELMGLSRLEESAVIVVGTMNDISRYTGRLGLKTSTITRPMLVMSMRHQVPVVPHKTNQIAEQDAFKLLADFKGRHEASAGEAQAMADLEDMGRRRAAKGKGRE